MRIVAVPSWAVGEFDHLIGRVACGTVVDRMPRWVKWVYGESYDVWPALAKALIGDDFERVGTVTVRVIPLTNFGSQSRRFR